ncbi:HTH CENPB-type domain-containing protein [Plasmodiophora brassicae]|uniref:HTH CENPB-type domain-containing protein n=1 Tax=Plasmodiophora brassicae TaxID=37360 RepID=A0A0G4J7J7_PLABS|nr:hypothetical protein PBRA_009445 [Plasmodiophora brassicae]
MARAPTLLMLSPPPRCHLHIASPHVNAEKLRILSEVTERRANSDSLSAVCYSLGVQRSQVRRWEAQRLAIQNSSPSARSTCLGRESYLHPIEETLLQWIFANRESGVAVSVAMVETKVFHLLPSCRRKSARAKDQIVRRLLAVNQLTIRIATPI